MGLDRYGCSICGGVFYITRDNFMIGECPGAHKAREEVMDVNAEIILGIEEFEDNEGFWQKGGYLVTTNHQEIFFSMDMSPSCCESFGYFISEDDAEKFIGEELLGIEVTDTNRLGTVVFASGWKDTPLHPDGIEVIHLDAGEVMFVDIKTTRGIFQLAAYNAHNGYYGHTASITSKQVTTEKTL